MTLPTKLFDLFQQDNGFSLNDNLFMACIVGSQSHGTYVPSENNLDDIDYFLVVIPPAERQLGLHQWEGWNKIHEELDVIAYSLEKYIRLLLKTNPNVGGTLWLRDEDYVHRSDGFLQLQTDRAMFSSQAAFYSYGGYADGQFQKILSQKYQGYMGAERKAIFDELGYDCKDLAHVIRIYRMGIEFLETGKMQVFRPDREELKLIKRGGWGKGPDVLQRIETTRNELNERLKVAKATSSLPLQPNTGLANEWLVQTQLKHLRK